MTKTIAIILALFFGCCGCFGQTFMPGKAMCSVGGTIANEIVRIQSMRTLSDPANDIPFQIVAMGENEAGKVHVIIVEYRRGKPVTAWKSGALPIEFSVHSPSDLSVVHGEHDPLIIFSGCAPHDCGGNGDIGVLVYSTAKREPFFAHSVGHNVEGAAKSFQVTYSDNAKLQANREYRAVIERIVTEQQSR